MVFTTEKIKNSFKTIEIINQTFIWINSKQNIVCLLTVSKPQIAIEILNACFKKNVDQKMIVELDTF